MTRFVFWSTGDRAQGGWVTQGLASTDKEFGFCFIVHGTIAGFYIGEQWDQIFVLEIFLWQRYGALTGEDSCLNSVSKYFVMSPLIPGISCHPEVVSILALSTVSPRRAF